MIKPTNNSILPKNKTSEILTSIEALEEKSPILRDSTSPFQLERFVVGSEFQDVGRFKQCLTEMRARVRNIEKAYLERERYHIDIESLMEQIKTEEDKFQRRRFELDLLEKRLDLREIEREISTMETEMNSLTKILEEIPLDSLEVSEEEYWEKQIRRKIALSQKLNLPISMNLIESALNMPEGSEIRGWIESILDESDNTDTNGE